MSELAHTLTELQCSADRKGPWCLYVFDAGGGAYHRGGTWFEAKPKYPEEGEITITEAKSRCDSAMSEGREVRICDGGDNLVFHAKDRKVLYDEKFWQEISA